MGKQMEEGAMSKRSKFKEKNEVNRVMFKGKEC